MYFFGSKKLPIQNQFPILDTNLWPSRSPVGAGSGGGGAGVGLPPDTKQPQLLLMRVSSVKSSRSSHDNESSNNNKRGTGGNQGSQQHKGPFTNYVVIPNIIKTPFCIINLASRWEILTTQPKPKLA